MGEIKSTLDLVMEKTSHLTLSSEEEKEQQHAEIHKKIKGMLLKYHDKNITREQLENTLSPLRKDCGVTADTIFLHELLDGLALDHDNESLLDLLSNLCGKDISEIESVLNDYQEKIRLSSQEWLGNQREILESKYSISGSAVVPNLEKDDAWIRVVKSINYKFNKLLSLEKENLSYFSAP